MLIPSPDKAYKQSLLTIWAARNEVKRRRGLIYNKLIGCAADFCESKCWILHCHDIKLYLRKTEAEIVHQWLQCCAATTVIKDAK